MSVKEQKKRTMSVVKSRCAIEENKKGEGNISVTMCGNVFLCKTNEEIKTPDFLIIVQTNLKMFLQIAKQILKMLL